MATLRTVYTVCTSEYNFNEVLMSALGSQSKAVETFYMGVGWLGARSVSFHVRHNFSRKAQTSWTFKKILNTAPVRDLLERAFRAPMRLKKMNEKQAIGNHYVL